MSSSLKQAVHVLSMRPFSNTSREAISEIGSTVSNPFYDARNIGNHNEGEIAPSGNYLTRYPTNVASNSAGFSITDSKGDERNLFPGNNTYGLNSLTEGGEVFQGSGSGGSAGSSSDYLYSNPYYASLLYPITRNQSQKIMSPLYDNIKYTRAQNVSIRGAGTNAPSAASYADYAMNNPYAFSSNFSGGALGAPAAGSSSDYFQSDPYRTPSMLREDIPRISNHMKGGSVDWSSFLLQARKALGKVNIDHVKTGINAVKTIDSSIDAVKNYRKGDKSKALLNLGSATLYGLSAKDSYNKTKKIQGEGKKSKSKSEKIARGLALLESMR